MDNLKWKRLFFSALGGWLIISPWILGFSEVNVVVWNNVLSGCAIFIFLLLEE